MNEAGGERLAAVRTYGLRFDVNCSILFTELPLLERPAAARAAGFDAVEFWWPFADPVPPDREVDAFVRALREAGVRLILLNLGQMGEDLAAVLARGTGDITHVQIGDVPDRGAPGTGKLDFEALFAQLAAQGYPGWIGCEYRPSDPADSSSSFGWRPVHAV
jgi:hydroxypyruvate isomerase